MSLAKSLLGPIALVGSVVGGVAQSLRKDPEQADSVLIGIRNNEV